MLLFDVTMTLIRHENKWKHLFSWTEMNINHFHPGTHTRLTCTYIQKQLLNLFCVVYMDRVKRIWYLSHMRAAKVQASLRIRAVSPELPLLAHTGSESRGTFRQKARSLAPLNGWACAVKICHDGMLEDTNSLNAVHIQAKFRLLTLDGVKSAICQSEILRRSNKIV